MVFVRQEAHHAARSCGGRGRRRIKRTSNRREARAVVAARAPPQRRTHAPRKKKQAIKAASGGLVGWWGGAAAAMGRRHALERNNGRSPKRTGTRAGHSGKGTTRKTARGASNGPLKMAVAWGLSRLSARLQKSWLSLEFAWHHHASYIWTADNNQPTIMRQRGMQKCGMELCPPRHESLSTPSFSKHNPLPVIARPGRLPFFHGCWPDGAGAGALE